jgi:NAD(P)-dependent dehydrogenase (short-subunit alcohol dehydrogenase family)
MSAGSTTRFAGKTAIVTGGAGGIGRAIVEALLAEGASVGVFDRDCGGASCAAWAAALPAGTPLLLLSVDVGDEAAVGAATAAVAARFGGSVHVLVNNAAAFVYGTVESVDAEGWARVLNTNIVGYANTQKHAIPLMRGAGGGAVVNISSISAFIAQADFLPYSVTKAAVLQMTRNVAMDVGKDNIRVNCVCPGPILTEATGRHAAGVGKSVEEVVAELSAHQILKRMGRASEVARAVLFLASDEASFCTGSHLMVDGGYILA